MPRPQMYDITIDDERDVTQADVDTMIRQIHVMARHRAALRLLEQMCHDACTGDLPAEDYYRIISSIENGYTSKSAQQAQQDQADGRYARQSRERARLNG